MSRIGAGLSDISAIRSASSVTCSAWTSSCGKTRAADEYSAAARWYRTYLQSFPDDANAASTNFLLAEVLFESGKFSEAAASARRALDLAKSKEHPRVEQLEQRARLYENSQPFRETDPKQPTASWSYQTAKPTTGAQDRPPGPGLPKP